MMQKQLLGVGILLTALIAGGCSDESSQIAKGYGTFSPSIGLDTEVVKGGASRADDITVNDLTLKLTKSDGTAFNWSSVGDFDPTKPFAIGDYTLEAVYGDDSNEGFELPYYYGSASFKVYEEKETAVSLTAQLGNSMVSTAYTDAFKNYMQADSWSASVRSATGKEHTIAGDETRPLYVKSGMASVMVSFTKANGNAGTFKASDIDMKPRTHYVVTFDVDASKASLNVTFDDGMEEQTVTIDISKDVFNSKAPEIYVEGFTSDEPITYVEYAGPEMSLVMTLNAEAGIQSVEMTTVSEYLTENNWPATINLAAANTAQQKVMTEEGLKVNGLWKKADNMGFAVLDFSDVVNNLPAGTHTFSIAVTDNLNRATEPVILNLSPTTLVLELESDGVLRLGENNKLYMKYNGITPESRVFIEMQNDRGTFTPFEGVTFTPAPEKGEDYYLVTIPTEEMEQSSINVRARCGKSPSNVIALVAKPAYFGLNINPVEVYSTVAPLSLELLTRDAETLPTLADVTFLFREAGSKAYEKKTFTDAVVFDNLTPATTYEVIAQYDGMRSSTLKFSTEGQAQLVNGNFNEDAIAIESGTHWYRWDLNGWATMNGLTTSQRNSDTFTYRYIANSGTDQTDEAHEGKAARIRTIGWGTGNTAAVWGSGFGTCKHITAGELFLGSWNGVNEENTYGIPFSDRPKSITFWYKYTTVTDNGDYATVDIEFKDAEGNLVAEAFHMDLTAVGEYTEVNVPLTFTGKVASLSIAFKSTGREDALKANKTWMTPPPARNLSTGEYAGSALYIDDVTLNY